MKKLLLLLIILLTANQICLGMGETPKGPTKISETGTPVFSSAAEQFNHAQLAWATAFEKQTTGNITTALNTFSDFRKYFPGEKKKAIHSYFFEAKLHQINNDDTQALAFYAKFLAEEKTSGFLPIKAESAFHLGAINQSHRKYSEAITFFKVIEKDYPTQVNWIVKARQGIADCLESLRKYRKSLAIMQDTLNKYSPNNYYIAYFNLKMGLINQQLGKHKIAKEHLQKVLALPEDSSIKGPQTAAKFALAEFQKYSPKAVTENSK
jgi:tetratricopeptide (TPR) repeat protein